MAAGKTQTVEVNFSQESRRKLDKLIQAVESLRTEASKLNPNTDYRVHDAITGLGYSSDEAKELMKALREAGLAVVENPDGVTQE